MLGQILTRGSLRIMVKNVDPNYDAYRRQKTSIKSCFGHKYVYVCEVRCQIVPLKSIFCPTLRRPRLEMKCQLVPTSPPGEHSLAESRLTLWCAYVSSCLPLRKNSGGLPNTCWKSDTITRQMHVVLVLFRPLPNVDIQKFGMYNLTKAYGNIENPFANPRVEDWEASNGHTKDKTRLFHGPWHNAVGEHICAQPFRMWNRLRFHTFLQVSQIFQRRKSDANKQDFWK